MTRKVSNTFPSATLNLAGCRFFFMICMGLSLAVSGQVKDFPKSIREKSFNPTTLLWYSTPAKKWDEALPVGNGRLGAMVFGKTGDEVIQLNEDTYWTGGPYSTVVKGGAQSLREVQRLVFNGDMLKAHNLFGRTMMGYPVEQQKYQSLANLHLQFPDDSAIQEYRRWLDLETGITAVQYTTNGTTYTREVFASFPDQLIVVRITANRPGTISCNITLQGNRNQTHSNYGTDYFRMDGLGSDGLVLTGKSADYLGVEGKLRYEARIKSTIRGGTMSVDNQSLVIRNANEVTLYFSAATNFINYKDVTGDQHARVEQIFYQAALQPFDSIISRQQSDYRTLFNRTTLRLPESAHSFLATNERIEKNVASPDPALAALAYQFGRYVLISSSRPGTQPANLQGIWNNDMNPMWDSKYTTNINTQMNYWAVESANLAECAEPLIKMVTELTDQGSQVAKEHYGCRGWVCHQNTDLWRVAAPMDGPTWGTFTTGGAWLCTQLWEHYLFTGDTAYLRLVYPVIQGSVRFFMDFLVPHPNGKWLVTNPSTSPENFPASPGNGPYFDEVTGSVLPGTTICAGSTIDMQILHDLFGYFNSASAILQTDASFAREVMLARNRLVPPQVGRDGALQEWADDWGQLEKEHRHASHLYGLFPGNVLSVEHTPEMIGAVKEVLQLRGDGAAGWSRAWKTALWARLKDGNHAYRIFNLYLKEQANLQLFAKCFSAFQVDGTLGMTAAITEMLLQSQDSLIEFLPSLPDEWKDGRFNGVCARGGFELSFEWKNKRLVSAAIWSKKGNTCRIQPKIPVVIRCNGRKIKTKKLKSGAHEFLTVTNSRYLVTPGRP